jgi:hypothetical protein
MAKLPPVKRLSVEDFNKDDQPLMEKLLEPLNMYLESVYYALNKNITFTDNIASQVQTVTVTAPVTDLTIANTLGAPCKGILVVNATNIDQPTERLATPPFVQFTNTTQGIKLTNVTGLTSGKKYELTIICLKGP